jgi:hypothetical protein
MIIIKNKRKILIIGGVAAGTSAASKAKDDLILLQILK